jgi:hypothetical protein
MGVQGDSTLLVAGSVTVDIFHVASAFLCMKTCSGMVSPCFLAVRTQVESGA